MSTLTTIKPPVAQEAATERIDAIACLAERVRRRASTPPTEPGRYIEVQGASETLLVALEIGVMHVGRGLSADLRFDEASVSRRHAVLVNRSHSTHVLDDLSSNGTFLNGRRIGRAQLRHGDRLLIGRVSLRYLEV